MATSARHIWSALHEKINAIRRMVVGYSFVRNATRVSDQKRRKKVLFVYLSEPFAMSSSSPRFQNHQNLKQSLQMVYALGEAGFVVDVMDVRARLPRLTSTYDVVVSHRSDLVAEGILAPGGTKVYLATGMNHETHNKNLRDRYERLNARRGCNLMPTGLNEERMPFVRSSDGVVAFGNRFTAGSWSSVASGPIAAFNNYAAQNNSVPERAWSSAKRSFLFYASRNQVGKGLDLLLEVFAKHKALHLYVCSSFKHEAAFTKCYERELFRTSNIHPIGLITKGERRFRELLMRSAFVILPSCSEGQPGSVIEGMHAGLIPLVTKETGLDVGGAGVVFDSDALERTILHVSGLEDSWHKEQSNQAKRLAEEQYSEAVFLQRWSEIARDIDSHNLIDR